MWAFDCLSFHCFKNLNALLQVNQSRSSFTVTYSIWRPQTAWSLNKCQSVTLLCCLANCKLLCHKFWLFLVLKIKLKLTAPLLLVFCKCRSLIQCFASWHIKLDDFPQLTAYNGNNILNPGKGTKHIGEIPGSKPSYMREVLQPNVPWTKRMKYNYPPP